MHHPVQLSLGLILVLLLFFNHFEGHVGIGLCFFVSIFDPEDSIAASPPLIYFHALLSGSSSAV
jgi:hypothetical protein